MDIARLAFFAGLAVLVSSAAEAATMSAADGGSAMVSNGSGFSASPVGSNLSAGDKVTTVAGKTATITYPDGCAVTVSGAQVVTIQAVSPCASAANGGDATPPTTTTAGAGGGVSPVAIVGGLALGGGIIAALASSKSSKSSPASP